MQNMSNVNQSINSEPKDFTLNETLATNREELIKKLNAGSFCKNDMIYRVKLQGKNLVDIENFIEIIELFDTKDSIKNLVIDTTIDWTWYKNNIYQQRLYALYKDQITAKIDKIKIKLQKISTDSVDENFDIYWLCDICKEIDFYRWFIDNFPNDTRLKESRNHIKKYKNMIINAFLDFFENNSDKYYTQIIIAIPYLRSILFQEELSVKIWDMDELFSKNENESINIDSRICKLSIIAHKTWLAKEKQKNEQAKFTANDIWNNFWV